MTNEVLENRFFLRLMDKSFCSSFIHEVLNGPKWFKILMKYRLRGLQFSPVSKRQLKRIDILRTLKRQK
jgi:hypothetical protein